MLIEKEKKSIEQVDIKIAFSMEFLIIWEWKL